jgi:hypothetical protein
MPKSRRDAYAERARQHAAAWDEQRRTSERLARFRLGTFLAAVASLVWWLGFDGGVPACVAAIGLFLIFGFLVAIHARVEEKVQLLDALRTVNVRGIARIDCDWDALPAVWLPPGVDTEGHPYAVDLDLFGRASLFQLLGPAATTFGNSILGGWLLRPAMPGEIVARQAAVAELAALENWRERLAALGILSGNSRTESIDTFLRWAVSSRPPLPAWSAVRVAVYVLLVALWVPLLLHVTGVWPNTLWGLPLVAGIAFSFFTAGAVTRAFDRAGAGERTVRLYAAVLEHIDGQTFSSPYLTTVKARLTVPGGGRQRRPAPAAMRALNRILGFADLRRGAALLHFPIQAFTLWDFHCLFALERWRRDVGPRVHDWFDAAGEIDALACLATLHHDHPGWTFPEISSEPRYTARALGHPLIPDTRRVANDVEVGPPGTVLLVTGSNMSGKSTLLRAIGVNAVLAEAGAPVCAASLRMPPCDIQTSIRIQDSLERGVSYFMAALARLKVVIDAAEADRPLASGEHPRVLFYLLDEILQGTNSVERGIAVQAVARHLLDAGAIGVMTTHDLSLANEEPLKSHARLVHFTETVNADGGMNFDYKLREGLATSRNALRLMQLIGIDVSQP